MCSNNSSFYSLGRLTQVQRIAWARPPKLSSPPQLRALPSVYRVNRHLLSRPRSPEKTADHRTRHRAKICLIFLEDLAIVSILFNEGFPPVTSSLSGRLGSHGRPESYSRAGFPLIVPPSVPPHSQEGLFMHARFTRKYCHDGSWRRHWASVPMLSPATRAGAADREEKSQETAAFDLARAIHADRSPRHGPARRHGARAGRLGAGSDSLGRVGELEPVGCVGHTQGAGDSQGQRNGDHRRPQGQPRGEHDGQGRRGWNCRPRSAFAAT